MVNTPNSRCINRMVLGNHFTALNVQDSSVRTSYALSKYSLLKYLHPYLAPNVVPNLPNYNVAVKHLYC